MSTTKHTLGPWAAETDHGADIPIYSLEGTAVATVWLDTNTEANAALIAAAPELLEALKAVNVLLEQGQPIDPEHDGAYIRAAIAKAEGR